MKALVSWVRAGALAGALVSVLVAPAIAEAARWYEDYLIAVQKIEAGGCSEEAINYLGAAIVDKPRPRRNARTIAAQHIDYLPYYQLARAHLACGNLKNARENLEKSRRWAVADPADLDRLEALIRRAEAARTAQPPPPSPGELASRLATAQESIQSAESAVEACDGVLGTAEGLGLHDPAWEARKQRAGSLLEQARSSLERGSTRKDLLALADADRLAKEAALEATRLRTVVAQAVEAARRPTPTPTSPPPPTPTATPTPPLPAPTPTPLVLPAKLRRAAELYFLRDYRGTLRVLAELDGSPARIQAAELLLRGAAALALSRLEPETSRELARRALEDLRRAHRLDPRIRPDPTLFPPSLLRAWAQAD